MGLNQKGWRQHPARARPGTWGRGAQGPPRARRMLSTNPFGSIPKSKTVVPVVLVVPVVPVVLVVPVVPVVLVVPVVTVVLVVPCGACLYYVFITYCVEPVKSQQNHRLQSGEGSFFLFQSSI